MKAQHQGQSVSSESHESRTSHQRPVLRPLILLALWAFLKLVARAPAQQYAVDWFKVAGGSGSSSNAQYTVSGTFGQADTDVVGDADHLVTAGFWSLLLNATTPSFTRLPAGGDLGVNPMNLPDDGAVLAMVAAADNCEPVSITVTHVDGGTLSRRSRTFIITAMDSCSHPEQTNIVYTWRSIAGSFLDNGVVKVGIDLNEGGAITYLSLSGSDANVVNDHDLGRQIQQSYYSGPQPYDPFNNMSPYWPNWPWNPIQSGDAFFNSSPVLAHNNDGQTIYVKCRPLQWALDNVPGECTFESWLELEGNTVIVSNRLVNARTDTQQEFERRPQELPAVYTIGKLLRRVSYSGDEPFTGGPLSYPTNLNWYATESWAAYVDSNDWGLGVYHPGAIRFGGFFAGNPGIGGPFDDPTGYMSPNFVEMLDSNIEYTYSYRLILGTLEQIRASVYAQSYRPSCNFRFKSDRQHWSFTSTTDAGWPINDHLRVSLASNDPQMWSPTTAFLATNVPRLYVCANYHMAHPANRNVGQLFWEMNNTGEPTGLSEDQSYKFTVLTDNQTHIYELDLTTSKTYKGTITQLRFDPALSGDEGDYVDLAWISSSPFANNDSVRPKINIMQAAGGVAISFFAQSAQTAGYVGKELLYDLEQTQDLNNGSWHGVPGFLSIVGDDRTREFTGNAPAKSMSYRVKVRLD